MTPPPPPKATSSSSSSSVISPFDLRQTVLILFLLLASTTRASVSSQNDDHDHEVHDGNGLHPDAGTQASSVLRMRRQSSTGNKTGATKPPGCPKDNFQCQDGNCLPGGFLCDGTPDCPDKSDEKGCGGCKSTEYRCGNGVCILKNKKCDGQSDCFSGDDEHECCKRNEFQCGNLTCIPENRQCNGIAECSDMSDEYNCGNSEAQPLASGSSSRQTMAAAHVPRVLLLAIVLVLLFAPSCV